MTEGHLEEERAYLASAPRPESIPKGHQGRNPSRRWSRNHESTAYAQPRAVRLGMVLLTVSWALSSAPSVKTALHRHGHRLTRLRQFFSWGSSASLSQASGRAWPYLYTSVLPAAAQAQSTFPLPVHCNQPICSVKTNKCLLLGEEIPGV